MSIAPATPQGRVSDLPTAAAKPYMPEAQIKYLTEAYHKAQVILEYGSGGSTMIAARLPGKYVMSVESSLAWTREMRQQLDSPDVISPVTMYNVDIGETGAWGRPSSDRSWRDYHNYPNSIWDEAFFRHPDLILIDGRFRTACLATALLRSQRPIEVLFDDYTVRPLYHLIERVIKPSQIIDKMAVFHVTPGQVNSADIGFLVSQYFSMTVDGTGEKAYQLPSKFSVPKGK